MSDHKVTSLEELSDLCTPWCIHVVGTLRIADHIAAGIDDIADLAKAAGCDYFALRVVLSHLVNKRVFDEIQPGRIALNEVSQGLLDPTRRPDLHGIGGRMAYAWGTLPTFVQTGQSGYADMFGLPFWEDLEAHPEIAESFDALMGPAGHGTPDPNFPVTGGWENVKTVVDVVGGTGAMLAEILRNRPEIRGTLVDLPKTVARSNEIFQKAGVANRVTVSGQNFFDPLPAGADLYLLKKVLNNWSDREKVLILRRCAEAAHPASRIVILGGISPDETPHELAIDLVMLGGRVSPLSEFRQLALEANLEISAAEMQASGGYVVECKPIQSG